MTKANSYTEYALWRDPTADKEVLRGLFRLRDELEADPGLLHRQSERHNDIQQHLATAAYYQRIVDAARAAYIQATTLKDEDESHKKGRGNG